ncbi:MAG TPA: hypothetical protein VFN78_00905, partial [Ktedonobacterales bacterium]|nr:hypothetical protein [Ktedonobacterales bacterium]
HDGARRGSRHWLAGWRPAFQPSAARKTRHPIDHLSLPVWHVNCCALMRAPSPVTEDQLRELHLRVRSEEKQAKAGQ